MTGVQRLLMLAVLLCWGLQVRHVFAEAATPLARSVKAAYLYQFAGYVEWPARRFNDPAAPIVIGVMGDDAMAEELEQVVPGRQVQGRALAVRRVRAGEPLDELHLLYFAPGAAARLPAVAANARDLSIVTVSDAPEGLAQGTVLNFVLIEGRVRFEVSLDAARQAEVKLSSRLLAVALRVLRGGP